MKPCIALALAAVLSAPLAAIYVPTEMENVPVARLVANLERIVAGNPGDPYARLNLARTHAIAFALKSETVSVVRGNEESGPAGRPLPVATTDARKLAEANAHLAKAIQRYDEAIARAREPHISRVARLGRGWAAELSNDKPRAIALYRELVAEAWPEDERRQNLDLSGHTFTSEAGGYLIPLLDPNKDKAEIDTLKARIDRLNRLPRPITPVAIPLRDRMMIQDVVDHDARVRFDADGSGVAKTWTWISSDAGWLVYEQRGAPITSALQFFGNVTFWLFWENGYDAMRALDDDSDGRLAGAELSNLFIWRDANQNGASERGEVLPLRSWDIVSLSYAHEIEEDGPAAAVAPHGVTFRDGSTRPTFDVWLYDKTR